MVLQQAKPVAVYGSAAAGKKITVEVGQYQASAVAQSGNKFKVVLPEMNAGGPYTMAVSGDGTVTLKNVLIGEVWLCSGQSNMQQTVHEDKITSELADVAEIRHFNPSPSGASRPRTDISAKWEIANTASVAGFSETAFFFSRRLYDSLKVPVGIIHCSKGATWIAQWMDDWTISKISQKPQVGGDGTPQEYYYGMIAPVKEFQIRGVLWYQGEWDAKKSVSTRYYGEFLGYMIEGWRKDRNQPGLPWVTVQLQNHKPGYKEYQTTPGENRPHTMIREHQRLSLHAANTSLAVIMDKCFGLHPGTREWAGWRSAYAALQHVYGTLEIGHGPYYEEMAKEGGKIRIRFANAGRGLVMQRENDIAGFIIAGADSVYHIASVQIDGSDMLVWHDQVGDPLAVRYGWIDKTEDGKNIPLYNAEGFPAVPFSTDWTPFWLNADEFPVSAEAHFAVIPNKPAPGHFVVYSLKSGDRLSRYNNRADFSRSALFDVMGRHIARALLYERKAAGTCIAHKIAERK
jgi:sialate O-acetylesterase